ncbi:Flp family type IVb pilin [Sphingobium cloacae]|uniref:Flp family type IVb pilin n=1 Tax=Sphingobium cloacae TaxID=120107 RepID=UPI00082CF052|nr:Flp family type IVb pilin [Sphingobium cloacae]
MRGLVDIIAQCSLARCQRGATAIEYALILAFIFLAIISAVGQFANQTMAMWTHVAEEVNSN